MDQPDFTLDDHVALVTGASRGIGRDLCRALAAAGATVAAAARDEATLDELCDELTDAGATAVPVVLDVTDVAAVRAAVDGVVERFGRLDVLVNNAGIGWNAPALEVTEDHWDDLMAVNLRGLFFCCQAAGRVMVEQGAGRIVNMSSQAGLVGIPDHAAYSASKGGVNLLTKVLALEWASSGVTVNAVAPTFIRTPGTAERLDQPEFLEDVLSRIPVGHVGTTSDVAGAVIYLASPAAGLVTGHVLVVDGGWTAR